MKRERDTDRSRENADRLKLEDAVDIVGTCEMMCPEFESLQRYFERDLDPFEKVRDLQSRRRHLTGFPVSNWRL